MIKTLISIIALVAAALPPVSAAPAQAPSTGSEEAYPTKTIRFILPFSPGGGTDVVARTLGQKMTEQFGQQVVIDNRGGVGGIVGVQTATQAEPDGHTHMLGIPAVITVSPAVFKNLPFDPINDLAPVGFAGTSTYSLLKCRRRIASRASANESP